MCGIIGAGTAVLLTLICLSMTGIGIVVGLILVNYKAKEERDRSD